MSNRTFKLTIQTPEGTLFSGDVTSIKTMTELGQIQVLAKHASFITSIQYSRLILDGVNETENTFILRRGVLSFNNAENTCSILAEYCQPQSEISPENVQQYLAFLESELTKGHDLKNIQLVYLENEKFAVKKLISN